MLTFRKGENVKLIDDNSGLIPVLKADGWHVEGEQDDVEALREQALAMGLKPHHKAGASKIKAMIEEAEHDNGE